ncbi:MAG: site-2 protease family protein [Candidatus Spechtbacterales bacterium]|nr:site-2 protease family protein [Candidatus Spechtbacterales bacterium]
MFITILLFVGILAIVVLTHEFGHFIVAKKSGMQVDEFGFGFPPKLFGIKKGETEYTVNLFPIGGFVRVHGEDGKDRQNPRSFAARPMWQRMLVIVAGVIMNFLVAYLFFSAVHAIGAPTILGDDETPANARDIAVQIIGVIPESPAQEAGIQNGDKIIKITSGAESTNAMTAQAVSDFIEGHKGRELLFSIERGNELLEVPVFAREDIPEGEGATGISLVRVGIVDYPLHEALVKGAQSTYNLSIASVSVFADTIGSAISSGEVPESVSGPVGIAVMTGTVRNLGLVYILQFIALISLSLGIINIVPFPALDGGRFAFLVAEKIKGAPLSQKFENYANAAGFTALILLIIFITIHDINKFF